VCESINHKKHIDIILLANNESDSVIVTEKHYDALVHQLKEWKGDTQEIPML